MPKQSPAKKKEYKIRSKYQPKGSELEDLQYVYERRQQMADVRAKYEKGWDRADKQYEMHREPRSDDDWQSNIPVPTTTAIVESQLAEIIDQNMRPKYNPRGFEDKPRAVVFNEVSDFAWEVGRTDVEIYKGVKDALIRGTGILQDYYRKEKRMCQWFKRMDKKKGAIFEKKEVVDYDDLFAEVVKLEDFYIDEFARGFTGAYSAKECIRRVLMDIDDFKNFFKGKVWNPMDNAKYVEAKGGDTNYYEFYKPPEGIDKTKQVEVLWFWGMRPTPGRKEFSDHMFVIANDVMIVHGPNPYNHKRLPFVRIVDILRSHHFYGTGEAKLLESIQEEQQTFRRMVIDRNHLDIDKGFLVSNRETELDDEDVISRPHMLVSVDDVDNIKPIEYGDISRSTFLTMDRLDEDAVRVTGYDDRMQAVSKATTATESAILKEATLKRLRSKIWLLRNLTTYQMGLLREANIRQFYTIPKVERILGEKDSKQYKMQVRDAYKNDRLKVIGGKAHAAKYRRIRMDDKMLVPTESGIQVKKNKGPFFFEASPDLILPLHGSFDIKIEPSPTLPVSKPLQQEKVSLMFDRLIQLAATGAYDPVKLGDALAEVHDFDPDDFKPEKTVQEKYQEGVVEKSIEVATIENQQFASGKELPPTPYAPEKHTEVHIAYINSPEVMQLPPDSPILNNLTKHVLGEIQSQEHRAQSQQGMGTSQFQYSSPSGPSAVNIQPNAESPQKVQTQQTADAMGAAF